MRDSSFRRSYETERLIIKILDESYVDDVLSFINTGASCFDQYESEKSADFYTRATQKQILRLEYNMAMQKTGVRFYVFLKDNPRTIIGTISYSFYKSTPFKSIMLGYKFLPDYWHMGYASESIAFCNDLIRSVIGIKRIEAYVLSDNVPSQTLLSRLGFRLEGTAYGVLEVNGIRRDHLQYSLI